MKAKTSIAIFIFGLASVLYAYFGLAVDNEISESDIVAISQLNVNEHCSNEEREFEAEVDCLKRIQRAVQAIGEAKCAAKADVIEPIEFLERNFGCCFDRARFIEKAARYYGFDTRRVFIIQPVFSSLANFLPLGQKSHATSEILTSRGWLGIDSNQPFILIDEKSNPLSYKASLRLPEIRERMMPREFFNKETDIIYGLYSRHGMFHGAKLPGPEFVFSELLHNLSDMAN